MREVPVPTYFTLGKYELPESIKEKIGATGGEVTDNLVFLGKLKYSAQLRPTLSCLGEELMPPFLHL